MKIAPYAAALLAVSAIALAQDAKTFPPEQVKHGAETFARHCSPCHGQKMKNPEAFDLKTFPHDQKGRFLNSVTNGKNSMPPWGGLLKPEEIEAVWSYIVTGDKD